MRRQLVGSAAVIVACLVTGCSDPTPSSESVTDPVILTLQASQVDFGKYQTFFLKPQIDQVSDAATTGAVDAKTAQPLLDATTQNMTAHGYRAVDSQSAADLAVEMVYTQSISSSVTCYSWWDPYYWGYPAYGYYPYYGSCDTTVWKSGMLATVIVDLTPAKSGTNVGQNQVIGGDAAAPPAAGKLGGIWFSGVYAVDLGSADALSGINQAFAQSPYLTSSAGR